MKKKKINTGSSEDYNQLKYFSEVYPYTYQEILSLYKTLKSVMEVKLFITRGSKNG